MNPPQVYMCIEPGLATRFIHDIVHNFEHYFARMTIALTIIHRQTTDGKNIAKDLK